MKKVFLLGDSIKGFYKQRVEEILGKDYKIWTPSENCRFAKYTLNSLRYYFSAMEADDFFPDIIHWNVGLWDLNHLYNTGKPFTECQEYIRDMIQIYVQLKKTGAKLILATTTPTRVEREKSSNTQHFNNEIKYYNEELIKALGGKMDAINDLYSIILENVDEYISEDFLHPSKKGVEILAQQVAKSISEIEIKGDNKKSWREVISGNSIDEIQSTKFE